MKILSIVGARPQFVKAAVFREYSHRSNINEILLHTGQHYDLEMSTGIFSDLGVKKPDISYNLNSRSHAGMTGEMLAYIEKEITNTKPDFVNVYGDTNSTLAGALAASKMHIPVIHIEAGLRSFNKIMPEEINRVLTDHMSDFLFCPTSQSVKNLHAENIFKNVHHVGDIMLDAINIFADKFQLPDNLDITNSKKIALMTVHRAENIKDKESLLSIIKYCEDLCDDYDIVFPVHPNTKNKLNQYEINTGRLICIEPLKYIEMQALLTKSSLVLTDSGGLQKEAYFHQNKCITLRKETEWVELVDAGWNSLWTKPDLFRKTSPVSEYGNGDCVKKIIEILLKV